MTPNGPTYDPTLGEDATNETEAGVLQFKGKVKIGSDKTEADVQREKYLQEVRERAENDTLRAEQEKLAKEERPKLFTNSKGIKNNGLRMDGGNKENTEEKRTFTNSKKAKAMPEVELDPKIPTVTKDQKITAQVTAKGWDD